MIQRVFLPVFVALLAYLVYRNHINKQKPTASTIEESDKNIKKWFGSNKFAFNINGAFLNRFYVDQLVQDPSKFELPDGQFYPRHIGFFSRSTADHYIWKIGAFVISKIQFTQYSRLMGYYRTMQMPFGFMAGIDPDSPLALKKELETNPPKDCKKLMGKKLQLAVSLTHSSDTDWETLLETVTELCEETCVTPDTCLNVTALTENSFDKMVRQLAWVSWLRYGEFSNCREDHNSERCLWPIQGGGLHKDLRGSEQTLPYLEKHLALHPDDLGAKWLMNIAHQTLGTYPEKVPSEHLVPPSAFASDVDFPEMTNVAGELGIDVWNSYGAVIIEDFNNDGILDSMHFGGSYNDPVKLFLGTGKWGKMKEFTNEANLDGIPGGVNAKQADFNNDGFIDVMIIRGGWLNVRQPKSLLRNNGDGTFTDITIIAGLWSDGASHGIDWADLNRDGLLDFFSWNEDRDCEMYVNQGDETFKKMSLPTRLKECKLVKGAAFGDIDNDLYPDIYISRYGYKNMLFRNIDGKGWEDVSITSGVEYPMLSFPTGWFDYNQDGLLDILVSGHLFEGPDAVLASYTNETYPGKQIYADLWGEDQKFMRLYQNMGDGTFQEKSLQAGLRRHIMTMSMNYGDLNNDGYPDIFMGTGQPDVRSLLPNRLYLNTGEGAFSDITSVSRTGHLQKGHGIAFNDLDNDGNVDIACNLAGAYASDYFFDAFFKNPGHASHGHYVKLKLKGTIDNAMGIGARIKVETQEGHIVHAFVHAGFSYGANQLSPFHIGIGNTESNALKTVTITWPAEGKDQVLHEVPIDSVVRVEQGASFEVVHDHYQLIQRDAEEMADMPHDCPFHSNGAD